MTKLLGLVGRNFSFRTIKMRLKFGKGSLKYVVIVKFEA